jgi:hypothetical protein
LEGDPQITFSDSAKANLAAGQVDPRLLLALANLASAEPIDIVQFGNVGPGASAGLLLRYADLAVNDQAANQPVFRVEFTAPSPLGSASS